MNIQSDYVDGALLPSQIKNLRHLEGFAPSWFIWGLPGDIERLRKRPHNPRGGPGKVDDPTTAGTLDNALEAMRRKEAGGVGLLMSTVCSDLVGVDLDNVIAGNKVHALGLDAIEHFKGGYIEVSPSGTGLRIFCQGELPAGTPKGSTAIVDGVKFEAYPAGTKRFLRTTGALIRGTRGEVVNCQAGLDWLAGVMIGSKPGSPDNASVQGKGSSALTAYSVDRDR